MERAFNAALSRGPGYERTPLGEALDAGGYYIDYREKTTAAVAGDPRNLLATTLAQLALGWWERHLRGEPTAHDRFEQLCEALVERACEAGQELHWPISVAVPKYGLRPPWISALTQAQAASVLVRAYSSTGDERYADLSLRAVRPLLPGSPSGLVTETPDGPVHEEAPSRPPSQILNGWIAALWGLWDLHAAVGDAPAGAAFEAGLGCLRRRLGAYDTGWWTLYSVYPHRVRDLAKPIYHRLHVDQLRALHRLTGAEDLAATAARWAAYDTPAARARAVAQKAVFAVAERRRRR